VNTPKKKKKGVVADYTQMKHEELNLKREELALRREQFELEKEERRHRMAMEKQKENQFLAIFQKIIDSDKGTISKLTDATIILRWSPCVTYCSVEYYSWWLDDAVWHS
jgi:ATP-dependent 26S proteasome regulatory subunit